jgi:hypothetical protein
MLAYFPPMMTKDFGTSSISLDLNDAKWFGYLFTSVNSLRMNIAI